MIAVMAAMLATSCMGLKKHVSPDQKVLNKNSIEIHYGDNDKLPKEIEEAVDDIKKHIKQEPNSHILGFGPRLSMRVYCLSNPKKKNFVHKYLRKHGQKPEIYNINSTYITCADIEAMLSSRGCFQSHVTFDSTLHRKHDINICYHVYPSPRYSIGEVVFRAETPEVDSLLQAWRDKSRLKVDDWYDQENLNEERTRIVSRLRNEGYYDANTDLIRYAIDTNLEGHRLSIRLNLRNPSKQQDDGTNQKIQLSKYHIDNIYIYTNKRSVSELLLASLDTTVTTARVMNGISHYYHIFDAPTKLRPKAINRSLFLHQGQVYRTRNEERSKTSLQSLYNFKFVNIQFETSPNSTDTNRLLNAQVFLPLLQRQRMSLSLEINNSTESKLSNVDDVINSGNLGAEMKLSYQNKNFFRGAELFNAEISLLAEFPKLLFKNNTETNSQQSTSNSQDNRITLETGLNFSINFPTFLFPFTKELEWQQMRPHTIVNLGGNYMNNYNWKRLMLNVGFGYSWVKRLHNHQLLPLEMTYVYNLDSIRTIQDDARQKYLYSDHFILDARYDYSYNTQRPEERANFYYLNVSVESAGNLLSGISRIGGGIIDAYGTAKMFNVPFSQYLRLSTEYTYYFYFGKKSSFVARGLIGLGLPYGNSTAMPYEKAFFGGGNTTIRSWDPRRLGPGRFVAESTNSSLKGIGDIQLVSNLEYRFPMFSIFEGALFTDIGNVWLKNKSDEVPNGELNLKELPQSIAVGIGYGLRAKISNFIIVRLDFGIPLHDPGREDTEQWLSPKYWLDYEKKDKSFIPSFKYLNINFGINYPF